MISQTQALYIDESIIDRLAEIGKHNGLGLSALLSEILLSYLEENDPRWVSSEDRRGFTRKKVMIPAMIFEKSATELVGRYHSATILDISLGGVRLSLPLERDGKTEIIKKGNEFEIIFSMNGNNETMYFNCNLSRMQKTEHSIQVGAVFSETNPQSHECLQKCLA